MKDRMMGVMTLAVAMDLSSMRGNVISKYVTTLRDHKRNLERCHGQFHARNYR